MAKFRDTDIGSIPSDWRTRSIDDLFSIQQGKSLSAKEQTGDYLKPFLRTANVFWGSLDLSKVDEMDIPPKDRERLALRYGDVLVCEGGDIGRTAVWKNELQECYYQNHLHRLRTSPNGNVNPFFFALWMQMAWKYLNVYKGVGNRTTIPNLSSSRLKELLVPTPSLSEQKKIAVILAKIWRSVETQGYILENLRELQKSLMNRLFTQGLRGEPLKKTVIGMMPKSWEFKRIGEECQKPQYGYTASASAEQVGPQFLRITDISEQGVDWTTVPYCDCPPDDFEKVALKHNDIVFARIGATTGKSYLVQNPPTAVFASYLIRIRPLSSIDPRFLFYFFNSDAYWKQINAEKGSSLKQGVNGSVLATMQFPKPAPKEQVGIANILQSVVNKIEHHDAKKRALEDLFKTTLNQLMTGQIRVKDLGIDTSEVEIA